MNTLSIHHPYALPLYVSHMARTAEVTDQPINVRLPRELHEAVLSRAKEDDRSLAQTVRVAIRYYLQETTPLTSA